MKRPDAPEPTEADLARDLELSVSLCRGVAALGLPDHAAKAHAMAIVRRRRST